MPGPSTSATAFVDEPAWVGEVLAFWFDEVGSSRWFAKDEALDAAIRSRFLALHQRLLQEGIPMEASPRMRLAAIIVLDQFSRNMFRGSAQAFAADPRARELTRTALARGDDQGMDTNERVFLYLPLEHSEDRADQARCVQLVQALGNENLLGYAKAHQALIDRFGRFPHRNAVLGRESTPEEQAFLEENPRGF